jgi:aryl-phospho-beta-D-glucosidase BglC (GH1 family)
MVAFLPAINTPVFSAEDEANRLLGRGINLGNALEAPQEGAWGVTLKSRYFRDIKNAGFNSVRIPISWSTHAGTQPRMQSNPCSSLGWTGRSIKLYRVASWPLSICTIVLK